jgi:hypothetical protein
VTTDSVPMSSSFNRVGAVAGFVFIACVIGSMIAVGAMPTAGDEASLVDYFTTSSGGHSLGLLVISVAIVPAVLFLAGLVGLLRSSDRGHGENWSTAAAAFWITALALLGVGVMIDGGLFLSREVGGTEVVLVSLWNISMASTGLMTLAFAGAAASVSIPVLKHGLRPAWYGWLGLLVGLFGVLGLGGVVSSSDLALGLGLAVFPLFAIWVAASSVFMYRDA